MGVDSPGAFIITVVNGIIVRLFALGGVPTSPLMADASAALLVLLSDSLSTKTCPTHHH